MNIKDINIENKMKDMIQYYEVDATGERIEVVAKNQDELYSKFTVALIERFKGVIPCGKIYGSINLSDLGIKEGSPIDNSSFHFHLSP